jgi:hypothetical protein
MNTYTETITERVIVVDYGTSLPDLISAGRYDWVMYGRRPQCKSKLTISEAFGCGHVFGL